MTEHRPDIFPPTPNDSRKVELLPDEPDREALVLSLEKYFSLV
jgi:hypothetical protein